MGNNVLAVVINRILTFLLVDLRMVKEATQNFQNR